MASDSSATVAAIMRTNGVNGQPGGKDKIVTPSYSKKFNLPTHFLGGNSLDVAAPSSVKDFVASHDGHTVIEKVGNPFLYRVLSLEFENSMANQLLPL